MADLKKNISYNFIYQVLVLILPFITAPYLSRVIGASGIGTYSLSQSVAQYFTYITLLGLTNYGNREIASVQNDEFKRSKTFFEIYSMQIGCFAVSIVAYIFYLNFFAVDFKASLIMGMWVISAAFDINWFFFGMEQFKITVTRNAIIKIFTVVCIFVFVNDQSDIYKYIFIMALGTLMSQICLWPFLKKYVHFVKPSFESIVRHIKPNLILFVPVISISIYKLMDKVMLGYMSSSTELGYYENAEKITTMILTLVSAVGTVMLPRMSALVSSNNEKKSIQYIDKTMLIVIAYVNAAIFGIWAVGNQFCVLYFGSGFERTGLILNFLVITVAFVGCSNVLKTQFLIPHKKDKIYITSAVLGAVVNFVVNISLIPQREAIGAAVGTICAEIVVFLFQAISVRKYLNFKRYIGESASFGIVGFLMFLIIKAMPEMGLNNFFSLVVYVLVGGLFYIICGFFLIKKWLRNIERGGIGRT